MKKLVFILLLFISMDTFAQANFSRFGVSLGGGLTKANTDLSYGASPVIPGFVAKDKYYPSDNRFFGFGVDYYFSPFITAGIQYNNISLRQDADRFNRAYIATFSAIELSGNVAAGQFINFSSTDFSYLMRNLNVSVGLGFISGSNNVADFGSGLYPSRQHADDLGKSKYSGVISFPISVGYFVNLYNVYQEPTIVIGINYKFVYTTSDDINGYNDNPAYFSNNLKDSYSSIGISLKYTFGPKGVFYRYQ